MEHDHVVTLGAAARRRHVLLDSERLGQLGVKVVPTDRGGDVTYHGPGQLVGYPIVALGDLKKDVKWYLDRLQESISRTLAEFGIDATDGPTGVWVGSEKICALGIRVERWVASHGFALNVDPDLDYFRLIVPCGIADRGVTSMARILGRSPDMGEVASAVVRTFGEVFGRRMVYEEKIHA